MRIVSILLIFTLASCATIADRTDNNSGVGFNSYNSGAPDAG